MEIKEFLEKKLQCKQGFKGSVFYTVNLKVKVTSDHLRYKLINNNKCGCCNRDNPITVVVHFNKPQDNLSIFQVGLLYAMWGLNKRLKFVEYANYHKCIAGKKFIENIKEIKKESN